MIFHQKAMKISTYVNTLLFLKPISIYILNSVFSPSLTIIVSFTISSQRVTSLTSVFSISSSGNMISRCTRSAMRPTHTRTSCSICWKRARCMYGDSVWRIKSSTCHARCAKRSSPSVARTIMWKTLIPTSLIVTLTSW